MRPTRAAVLILAVAIAAGCGDDDDRSIPVGTTTSTTEPTFTTETSAAVDAETELVARYEAFWDARFAANQEPVDPDDPALREFATGAQLENVIDETTRNRDEGLAFRRPANSVYERRVTVIEVAGGTARLQDCVTNDGIVYRVADGTVVEDSVATNSLEATMQLVEGEWKLASARLLQRWEGVAGCALAE